jgi:hypothetical protein
MFSAVLAVMPPQLGKLTGINYWGEMPQGTQGDAPMVVACRTARGRWGARRTPYVTQAVATDLGNRLNFTERGLCDGLP